MLIYRYSNAKSLFYFLKIIMLVLNHYLL